MRDLILARDHIDAIKNTADELERDITLMEICGGHTNVIMRYGIRDLLPPNIHLISGPGCPVCVSSQFDIDCIISLAQEGIPVATYGDMLRVPGSTSNLSDARAEGGKVFDVYSTTELLAIRKKHPDILFFGVGFETTTPMTCYLLENDVCVYSVHKLVPPVMKALLMGEVKVDGFIDPGHVSTIIGVKAYRDIKVPQVISGFAPEQILRAIRFLVEAVKEMDTDVINGYPEAVKEGGNLLAQDQVAKNFSVCDSIWRGLGTIPSSGLEVKEDRLNARIVHADILDDVPEPKDTSCRCGDILRGLIEPVDCPLYAIACSPEDPKGACMVSDEGSCAISYRYGKR